MMNEIADALARIEAREKALERELKKLRIAREVLASLEGSNAGISPPTESLTLRAAIDQALERLQKATSKRIYHHVAQAIPTAKKNSIRSLLSVGKAKNRYGLTDHGLWYLKGQEENATIPSDEG